MLVLEGQRCRVRQWLKSDAESLAEYANNINIAKNLRDRFPHPYTLKDARSFLKHAVGSKDPSNLAIEANGVAVGAIGYVQGRDVERYSAEIGYWLAEPFWGQGMVTEAVELVTRHAFEQLNLLRLFALPFAENAGSVRVLEKAGYVCEGRLRASSVKYGESRDQFMFARINPAWVNRE